MPFNIVFTAFEPKEDTIFSELTSTSNLLGSSIYLNAIVRLNGIFYKATKKQTMQSQCNNWAYFYKNNMLIHACPCPSDDFS